MERKSHWEGVYEAKDAAQVSWYQMHLTRSLELMLKTGVGEEGQIIDVGGGTSTLVDDLLDKHFRHVTVLDISSRAIKNARSRLGSRADQVTWLEADITQVSLPRHFYDVWHDRAVFHFLTEAEDREHYINAVKQALKPGGHIIVATFGLDGPLRCSGIEVARYSPAQLHGEFGGDFQLIDSLSEDHLTPWGAEQKFIYCYCKKR